MEKEKNLQFTKNLKTSGIIIIICSSISILIGLLIMFLGTVLLAYPETGSTKLDIEAYIFLFGGLFSLIVAVVDLIAGIKIHGNSKRIKGWAIYIICAGLLGGLLGYLMLGIGVYVLIQLNDKSNSVEQEVVTNT